MTKFWAESDATGSAERGGKRDARLSSAAQVRGVKCYSPVRSGMGSEGGSYCRRECQSSLRIGRGSSGSWAGDGCEGHRPAHEQAPGGSALAEALEERSWLIGFVSTAAGL